MDDLLWKLPLFDDIYYSMQGQNVMLVDVYLRGVETDVRNEYYKLERTPVQSMIFLSAISQMRIFSVYELLRTWRQAVRDIKKEAGLQGPAAQISEVLSANWPQLQGVAILSGQGPTLRSLRSWKGPRIKSIRSFGELKRCG
jgi:hypothetical protein